MRGKMPARVLVRAAARKTLALLTTGTLTDHRSARALPWSPTTKAPWHILFYRLLFGRKQTEDAASGYDAIDQQGTRYLKGAPPTQASITAIERNP
jgi:hypothetical protein